MDNGRKKIAILGGGVGALTAAWYLTSKPDWQREYEITLYQLGWRLGGKGATGRNAEHDERIQEHGLHVWFGWYENAFRTLGEVYDVLDRAPGQPIATLEEAFTPRSDVRLLERLGEHDWSPWDINFPVKEGVPGHSKIEPLDWDIIVTAIDFVVMQAERFLRSRVRQVIPKAPWDAGLRGLAESVFDGAVDLATMTSLHAAHVWIKALGPHAERARAAQAHEPHHRAVAQLLRHFRTWLHARLDDTVRDDDTARRTWIILDLTLTCLIGFFEDHIYTRGLEQIDDWELSDWLRERGAAEITVQSTPVRALYDCFFGYLDGDVNQRCIAAGAGLGCALRIGVAYHGSVLYLMNAGMGEVIVAPVYQALVQRGVRFQFFRRVEKLEPNARGTAIERIHLAVQARVKKEPYEPLISVNSLPVWPDRPRYEQLKEGDDLRDGHVNLESHWADWTDPDHETLECGEHFDTVLLGIALPALNEICKPLAARNDHWRDMLAHLPSMQTFGVQLWMTRSLEEMGWRGPPRPAVAMPELLDVWADMSQTLEREAYKVDEIPRAVIYLCGPLPGDYLTRPPSQHDVPDEAWDEVYALAKRWLEAYPGWIWPKSTAGDGPGLDWNLLFADEATQGVARLREQFLRANIDPTERYVLSPPKWNRLRMRVDDTGFTNLILAGDWTQNVVNAGCVEAATISGMMASRSICGVPHRIAGEHFMVG